jgi:acetoacetyl-CoA synthetase
VSDLLWTPPAARRNGSRLARYLSWLAGTEGLAFDDYQDLWRWSVTDVDAFWRSIWRFFDVGDPTPRHAVVDTSMPGTRWFPGVEVNLAGHVLRRRGDDPAVISVSQTRPTEQVSWSELADAVGRARTGLVGLGVRRGDRVAAYLPNIGETVVALLATASLGAVWSSCAPEFGVRSVIDRFAQIEPTVLLATLGYRYGTRTVDRTGHVEEISAALPSLRATVTVPYGDDRILAGTISWSELLARPADPADPVATPVPFDHPLAVLFSSGTTGLPKAIVHGHGGILLEHLKSLGLHGDLVEGERFFWFSTTGWMMWNYLVSGLLLGTTVVCFDGDPAAPDLMSLWRMADELDVAYFGTSAPFLMACRRQGLRPGDELDLARLRTVGSTGAPLPAAGYRWVYDAVAGDVELASISGGTDVCSAFVGSSPLHPVRAGRIACRCLGAKVEAYDDTGTAVIGHTGELVVSAPMPSMPVGLWGDDDGSRYRAAYFETYPGVWDHGDWITVDVDGSCVISGRSDATLNRGGVRLGTAEFGAVVEAVADVQDSLVVHLEDADGDGPGELWLFVVLSPAVDPDDVTDRIRTSLRDELSPRHVPDRIEIVPAVPRTLSGKKLEVPVKRILLGADPDRVASRGALADPGSLDPFVALAKARLGGT